MPATKIVALLPQNKVLSGITGTSEENMDDKKGKCPHCNKLVAELNVARITLNDDLWGSNNGYSYSCPSCQTVVSASFSSAVLTEEIKKVVESALLKHLKT